MQWGSQVRLFNTAKTHSDFLITNLAYVTHHKHAKSLSTNREMERMGEKGERIFFFFLVSQNDAPKSTNVCIFSLKSKENQPPEDINRTDYTQERKGKIQHESKRLPRTERDRCKESKTSDGYIQVTSKELFSWNIFQAVLFIVMAAKYWLRVTWAVGVVFSKPFGVQSINIYRKINGLMMVRMDERARRTAPRPAGTPSLCFWNDAGAVGPGSKFSFWEYSQTEKRIKRNRLGSKFALKSTLLNMLKATKILEHRK